MPITRVVVLRERGGRFRAEVPPVPAPVAGTKRHDLIDSVTGLSCGAPGSCLGVGMSIGDAGEGSEAGLSLAFTPNRPQPIAQTPAAVPFSVSCPSTAFCLVGGGGSVQRYTPSFGARPSRTAAASSGVAVRGGSAGEGTPPSRSKTR